ncbi:MAG: SprB repeat-containing protein, partial [Ginsengibacter sp.]
MKKKLQFLKNLMIGMIIILCGSNLHAQCPTIFNVTGGGARCSNGGGISVGLSGSQKGVTYQYFRGGTPAGVTLNGTGYPISIVTTSAGTYTIVATNTTSSCMMTMNGSATITINPTPNFSFTTTDISCAGSDGSITATGSGGTPGYLFNIDGGPFSGSNVFTGLSAGNHSVAIQDANSCSVTKTIPIQGASPLSVEISGVNPGDCSGANGSITANRVGGVDDGITPVQFKLDGSATRPYQNSNVFGGLSKGDYTVTVKDSKGCTAVS